LGNTSGQVWTGVGNAAQPTFTVSSNSAQATTFSASELLSQ
jgi:hypothetical protein